MINIKLLAVDDEVMVRSFIKTVIDREKLPVSLFAEADNGTDAVRLSRELKPDLIFMDIRIPDGSGINAAEKILADNPEARIVVISAYGEFEYARAAFRAGVRDYLLKPVRPADIAELVRKAAADLGKKHSESADQARKPDLLRLIEDYIDNNLNRQIHLSDMAQAVFISPFHLSRTFKRLTGQSIVDFMHERRLAKAEELLSVTSYSVTEVAGRVGFNDAAYFATCFKSKKGLSPTQYRKEQDNTKNQQEFKRLAAE